MNLSNYGEVFNNYDLTNNNTYGLHSKCKYFVKVFDEISLKNLIEYLNKEKEKYFILGGGSNVILGDTLYDGVIISLEKLNDIKINNNIVEASSGILLSKFVNTLVDNNLEGYERLALIPGSLGGALYGNAGCHNTEIYDHLISIKILENNEIRTILKKDIKYSYRNTEFKKEKSIILSAKFELSYGDKEKMNDIIRIDRMSRIKNQPLEYKNAGSVFKNPEGMSAGKLIEDSNLKGTSINGAEVSMKHANFIINKGNATRKDILELINVIKTNVKKNNNIDLELEQVVVDWD